MTSHERPLDTPQGGEYRILREADLRDYLAPYPAVAARLGGSPAAWSIGEVGDGNLNLVFIVKGASGGIAVKQALPYVRLVGESWPLPLSRAHYEHQALTFRAGSRPAWCRPCSTTIRRLRSPRWSCSSRISSCERV